MTAIAWAIVFASLVWGWTKDPPEPEYVGACAWFVVIVLVALIVCTVLELHAQLGTTP